MSTNEVCQVVASFPAVAEANVYGVEFKKEGDGRAGMASIAMNEGMLHRTLDSLQFT